MLRSNTWIKYIFTAIAMRLEKRLSLIYYWVEIAGLQCAIVFSNLLEKIYECKEISVMNVEMPRIILLQKQRIQEGKLGEIFHSLSHVS